MRLLVSANGQLMLAADPQAVAALLTTLNAIDSKESAKADESEGPIDLVDLSVCVAEPIICNPAHLYRLVSQHMTALQVCSPLCLL